MTKDNRIKPLDIIELKENVRIDVKDIEDYEVGEDHIQDLKFDLSLLEEYEIKGFSVEKGNDTRHMGLDSFVPCSEELKTDLIALLKNIIITKINQITTELNDMTE